MSQKAGQAKPPAETVVKEIRRATRKHYSAEEKIRIVLESLRGEDSIADAVRTRRPGIEHRLSMVEGFPESRQEAPGRRCRADATSDEVKSLRRESLALKEAVA